MSKDFQVTVHEPVRAAEFEKIFGCATVYVRSFIPQVCTIEVDGEMVERECYMLDMQGMTIKQFNALADHVAAKFGAGVIDVRGALLGMGLPILATDCTLVIHNPQRWTMEDFDDDDDFDYDYGMTEQDKADGDY